MSSVPALRTAKGLAVLVEGSYYATTVSGAHAATTGDSHAVIDPRARCSPAAFSLDRSVCVFSSIESIADRKLMSLSFELGLIEWSVQRSYCLRLAQFG